MKNPLKWLKHVVKDPVKTMDEANARKQEIMPALYVSLGLIVVGVILQVIGLDFMTFLTVIGGVGAAFFAFLLFVIKKAKERFAALTCECGEMFEAKSEEEFLKYVAVTGITEKVSSTNVRVTTDKDNLAEITASANASATVELTITCPKCGKKRTLVYSITPFKIERKEKKVGALVAPQVKMQLEAAVTEVANDYKNGKGDEIPFSIHSVHNPKYAEKTKPQAHNNDVAFPVYKGVKIMYHRTVAELVRGFFLENELNGSISVKQ